MKRVIRKLYSILLVLCMAVTLIPVSARAAEAGEIVLVSPSSETGNTLSQEFGEGNPTLTVDAHTTNSEPITYVWGYYFEGGGGVTFNDSDSNSYTIIVDSVYTHEYFCEMSAAGCAGKVVKWNVTIGKGTYKGLTEATLYVKTVGGYQNYLLPQLPVSDMEYDVIPETRGPMISSEPNVGEYTDGWYTMFNTNTKASGTSEMITYQITGGLFYNDSTFTLTVMAASQVPVTVTGITGEDGIYSGQGQKGYSGTPTAEGYSGYFDYTYKGRGTTVYNSSEMPKDAGDYSVTVSPHDSWYQGSAAADFTIAKKEVMVSPPESYISRLDDIPQLNVWEVLYDGFVGEDNTDNCLSQKAVPQITVADSTVPGEYPIDFQSQAVLNEWGDKNYYLNHRPGKLHIGEKSGQKEVLSTNLPAEVINSDGYASITSTVVDVSSFTISATVSEGATWALYKDEALTQEIPDKTVSLVVGENIVYLNVTAETGMSWRWYKVTITRRPDSITPTPTTIPTSTPMPTVTPNPTSTPNPTLSPNPTPVLGGGNASGSSEETPAFRATGSDDSWKEISKGIESTGADQARIAMNGTTVIPASVLEAIAGKDIAVTFELDDKVSWTISGSDLKALVEQEGSEGLQALDMKATVGSGNIPSDVMENLKKQLGQKEEEDLVPLSLSHEGSFGFTAYLSVYVNSAKAGKTANLFYYNPVTKQLEFQYAGIIDENGYVRFPFRHASEYAIALDDGIILRAELDKAALSADKELLYIGGNTGKATELRLDLPEGLKNLSVEDALYPAVTYTSSNPKVAKVSADGKVTALKKGKTTITAVIKAGDATQTLRTTITVKDAYIKLTKTTGSLKKGKSFTYKAVGYGVSNDKITFVTTKKSIVVINKKSGKAIAKSAGTDYVIARYGKIQVKQVVTVK